MFSAVDIGAEVRGVEMRGGPHAFTYFMDLSSAALCVNLGMEFVMYEAR